MNSGSGIRSEAKHQRRPLGLGTLALVGILAAGLASCKQGVGDRCQVDSDCSSGLMCVGSKEMDNATCKSTSAPTSGTGGTKSGAGGSSTGGTSGGGGQQGGAGGDMAAGGAGGAGGEGGAAGAGGATDVGGAGGGGGAAGAGA
ncbi:MAG TPA: hypothetical protein VHU40_02485 [Polyangia bacterium]|nr:hypothetical protein [Polyangia bacterium]